MGIAHQAATAIGHSIEKLRAGEDRLAARKLGLGAPTLAIASSDFIDGGRLPMACTADSAHAPIPPSLRWGDLPAGTRSLVLVAEDPDAPFPLPFVHWLVYDIAAGTTEIGVGPSPGTEGKNSKLATGFTGAAPPPGHGVHHYHFQLFALGAPVALEPGAGRGALLDRMRSRVIAWGEIVGTYERK